MRIANSAATSNPAAPAPANTSSPGGAFQSILASASQQAPATLRGTGTPNSAGGRQEEKQTPSAQSNTASDASQPEKVSPSADTAVSQQTTNTAPVNGTADTANGASSDAATASSTTSVSLPPALAWLASLNGQPAIANSSQQRSDGSSASSAGSKATTVSSAPVRTSAKLEKAQAGAASGTVAALPVVVLPSAVTAPQNSSSAQDGAKSNDGGTAAAAAIHAAATASDLSHQISSVQPAGETAQHAAQAKQPKAENAITESATTDAAATTAQQGASTAGTLSAAQIFTLPEVPGVSVVSSNGDLSQSAGKAALKDAVAAKNPDLASTTDASASKPAANGSSDPSAQTSQISVQPVMHTQGDPSQVSAAAPRSVDGSAAAAQTLPIHGLAVDTTHKSSDTPAGASATGAQRPDSQLAASESGDAGQTSGINTARVLQSMGETEMRVGMRSTEFGDISIRTTVSQQQMLTQISLDHGDLSQAIAAHVSTVQAKLGSDYGLQASIQVHNQGSTFSGDSGQSSPREQKGYSSSTRIENFAAPAESDSSSSIGPLLSAGDGYRLDIRA